MTGGVPTQGGLRRSGSLGLTTAVTASRTLRYSDNGTTLDMINASLTLTVPNGLPPGFACSVQPNGVTSVASSQGTLLNGATSTITRDVADNTMFSIVAKSTANSYVVTGV